MVDLFIHLFTNYETCCCKSISSNDLPSFHVRLNVFSAAIQKVRNFVFALYVSASKLVHDLGLEGNPWVHSLPLNAPEIADRHLQDVGFLQFRVTCTLLLKKETSINSNKIKNIGFIEKLLK